MKKYYDLPEERIVAMLDWKEGHGSFEEAKAYFKSEIREISKKEFDVLGEEYTNGGIKNDKYRRTR